MSDHPTLICPQCGNTSEPQPLVGVPIFCTRGDKHKKRYYVQMIPIVKEEK